MNKDLLSQKVDKSVLLLQKNASRFLQLTPDALSLIRDLLANLLSSLLALSTATGSSNLQLIQRPAQSVHNLGVDGCRWAVGTILEVGELASRSGPELIQI